MLFSAPLSESEDNTVNTVTGARVISWRYGHIFWFVTASTTPDKACLGVKSSNKRKIQFPNYLLIEQPQVLTT